MSDNPASATIEAPAAEAPTPAAPAAPEWRAGLPPDLRDSPSLGKFTDPAGLAKSYVELETLIGRKGLVIPGEKDGAEVHARFRQALGVPDAPEGYGLKAPEGVPAEVWSDDSAKQFAGWAHKHGLTPTQAQGIAADFAKHQAANMPAPGVEADGRSMEDHLRGEWGSAYAAKVDVAKRAAQQFAASPAVLDALEAKVGGAEMIRLFARIGEAMGEDRPAGMGTGRSRGVLTPDEAKAELAKLRASDSPYWDRQHPEHKTAVARALALEEMRVTAA
ncbi:MAG: hypothetical protein IT555_10965 [Acetobacteraceae bacterium]|nr:hypothetical protein [Acetobacteraceae bacterium]